MHERRIILGSLVVVAVLISLVVGIAPNLHPSIPAQSATDSTLTSVTTQSTADVLSTVDTICSTQSNQQATSSFSGVPQIVIGNPTSCRVYDQGSRAVPSSWILYEVIPVSVFAPASTILTLSAPNLPPDSWAHFGTNPIVASLAGANTTLTVIGVVVASQGSGNIHNLTVMASSSSLVVSSTVHVSWDSLGGRPLTVLSGEGVEPFFPTSETFAGNDTASDSINMVYDPSNASTAPSSLRVNLKVLGVVVDGSVKNMPSKLSISFSKTDFTLNPYQPDFLTIDEFNTISLGSASLPQRFVVAVAETINGTELTEDLTVTIEPPGN